MREAVVAEKITYGVGETPFGPCFAAVTGRGVCALRFLDVEAEPRSIELLEADWPGAELARDDAAVSGMLEHAFAPAHAPALDLKGTEFQLRVWDELLQIPEGETVSYSELAERVGRPTAARAVANAVGANRVGYLVPCHRVVRSGGELGGYRWGVERKGRMLERERMGRRGD